MNKKTLAVLLSRLNTINNPKPYLEQYQTDSEIASIILWQAYMNGDIEDKLVADLGCGNGIFGIGALLLGAKKVYFVEKDKESVSVLKQNLDYIEGGEYEIVVSDIQKFNEKVDLIVENPPFGVQKAHNDKIFLEKSFEISQKIYSLHKIESKEFIQELSNKHCFSVLGIIDIDFVLKKTMRYHKKTNYNVKVGCWILEKTL
jgi:putative methylase